jgi:hypothetical protein
VTPFRDIPSSRNEQLAPNRVYSDPNVFTVPSGRYGDDNRIVHSSGQALPRHEE